MERKGKQQESKLSRSKSFELHTFTIMNREDKSTAVSVAICEHSISSNISHACYKRALTWSIYKTYVRT